MTDITPEAAQPANADAPQGASTPQGEQAAPAKKAARKRAPRKKAAAAESAATDTAAAESPAAETAATEGASTESAAGEPGPDATEAVPAKKAARKRAPRKKAAAAAQQPEPTPPSAQPAEQAQPDQPELDLEAAAAAAVDEEVAALVASSHVQVPADGGTPTEDAGAGRPGVAVLFQAPEPEKAPRRRRRAQAAEGPPTHAEPTEPTEQAEPAVPAEQAEPSDTAGAQPAGEGGETDETGDGGETGRKRRRRGGRGRRGRGGDDTAEQSEAGETPDDTTAAEAGEETGAAAGEQGEEEGGSASSRRRRRRRRRAGSGEDVHDDEPGTVTKVRQPRKAEDEVASVKGSTRLEAKKQRRRDGREAGRRKPVITESEFLARRESVERTMIVREREGRTQIAVLEDDVLVEHYVANETNASMIGNVYLGRVQNVLPSMEAAFIDIGKGRNAVLYAGEVNWDAAGLEGQPRRIEAALKSGDQVLVQVTKDPMGHKGARLTSQISLPGRYLVYVPNGSMTGISRKLPDTERSRLKKILKAVVPEQAGVIVRTAAEGASEAELQRDVERLTAQWADIEKKASSSSGGSAPKLLHGEPDLTVRVIRDVFNEDFKSLVVSGRTAWDVVQPYLASVAPDLAERASRWTSEDDVFAAHRVDEQLAKAMDRKVWLPSGGSLVIDRTEAMTVVDVNTGKFTGSGGNLEETVTRNNLEAAEEIVRQLRLRDIGGIIVVDFIDMVLEGNRDLVLRRLLECLGRDRTKHQVAEVTSLGLVQMTRKRVGQGLLEVFSEPCEHCNGRGIVIHAEPVQSKGNGGGKSEPKAEGGAGRSRRGRGKSAETVEAPPASPPPPRQPIPAGLVASLAHHHDEDEHRDGEQAVAPAAEQQATEKPATEQPATEQQAVNAAVPPVGEESAVAEQAAVAAQQPAERPAQQPATEQQPVAAEAPKQPRRRRRASAPAGPPTAAS